MEDHQAIHTPDCTSTLPHPWVSLFIFLWQVVPSCDWLIIKTLARRTAIRASVFQRTLKSPDRDNCARLEYDPLLLLLLPAP